MKAVIMAGGFGSRLMPVTGTVPKPALTVAGKPCIVRAAEYLKNYGINKTAATAFYKADIIRKLLEPYGTEVFVESVPLGTAGSVKGCERFLDEDFVVLSGDAVCSFDLSKAISYHYSHGGMATIVLTEAENPLEYGVCVTDEKGVVERFIEKPSWSRAYSDKVNTGIYIFSRKILNLIQADTELDFSADIFPLLMQKGIPVHAYTADGYWCDIGSVKAYLGCNCDVLGGVNGIDVETSSTPEGCEVRQPCYIGKNVKADGAVIGPYAVIGDNCVIRRGATVEKSVLFDGVKVHNGAHLRGCVVCSDSVIGENTSVDEYAVVGSSCTIGNNCIVAAEGKIYPNNVLSSNTIVKGVIVSGYKRFVLNSSEASLDGEVEEYSRLGAAFCSAVAARLAVGVEDSEQLSYKSLVTGGATSVGGVVYELGECDRNAFRFTIRNSRLDGGIFIGSDKLYLYAGDGLLLPRKKQRAFEYAFSQNSFHLEKTGSHRMYSSYMPLYETRIKKYMINSGTVNMRVYAPDFLCRMIDTLPDKNAEKLYVGDTLGVDDYSREAVECAVCLAYGSAYGRVYIPYGFPSVVETLGEKYGFEVVRLTTEDSRRSRLYDMTDSNIMAAVLTCFLSRRGITFAKLAEMLPKIYTCTREVGCDGICGVMRSLSSKKGIEKELEDGVKYFDRKNARTVRIIPEQSIRGFKIIAEGSSIESAREICDFYANKIGKDEKNIDTDE